MKIIITLASMFLGLFLLLIGMAGIDIEDKKEKGIKTKLTAHFLDLLATYGLISYFVLIFKGWRKNKPYPQIALFGIVLILGSMATLIIN